MAHLLQAVVLLLAGASAPAADFSHRLHLKLKTACADCHTTAALSVSARDNLRPAREVCLPCHKEPVMTAPMPSAVAQFNHREHLKVVKSCTGCHRGVDTAEAIAPAASLKMADCVVCHNQIDPPDSCVKCHAPGFSLKPADHRGDFMDRHSKPVIAKAGCAVCHGKKFTCMGCH